MRFCLLLFLCAVAGAAQQPNSPAKAQPAKEPTTEPQPAKDQAHQPPEELQSMIKALSGKWSLAVKFDPNPDMPSGFMGAGDETWRTGPGGFTFLEEEHIPTPAGDAFLLG